MNYAASVILYGLAGFFSLGAAWFACAVAAASSRDVRAGCAVLLSVSLTLAAACALGGVTAW